MVLVDPSADKHDLPRFRPPKVKALRPACLRLMIELQIGYNGEIVRFNLARVSGGEYERVLGRRSSLSLNSRTGSRILYRLGLYLGLTSLVFPSGPPSWA